MKVLKCDRCGEFYTKGGSKIKINTELVQDLCPDCTREFKKWWSFGIQSTNDKPDYEEEMMNLITKKIGNQE